MICHIIPVCTPFRQKNGPPERAVKGRDMKAKLYAATAFTLWASPVLAQEAVSADAEQSGVQDIVVTAQRRVERLQDVPIAISAITATRLEAAGVATATDLGAVTPALNTGSTQNYFQPRLRGIGTQGFGPGVENPIATYIDGVYIASAPASLLSLADIERVEVLKGPQGTLFGRNATGGLIQVVTSEPSQELKGSASVSYGNYRALVTQGSISGGNDTIVGSLAVRNAHQSDGFGRNFVLNEDTNQPERDFGVRAKVVLRPTPTTTIHLSGDYTSSSGSYPTTRQWAGEAPLFGPPTPGGPWDADNDTPSRNRLKAGGAMARIDQDLGGADLVSITAYRESSYFYQLDFDGTRTPALFIVNRQSDWQFSQELQLASAASSPVKWLVGAYYFRSNGAFDPATVNFDGPNLTPQSPTFPVRQVAYDGKQESTSWAAFAQATVPLNDRTNLTAGLRYTTDKRSMDVTQNVSLLNGITVPTRFQDSARFGRVTWRAALDYRLTPDSMIYASYNRGFKSGGFNLTVPSDPDYRPEVLDAFEVGVKADLFDRVLRLNPSVFYYDYQNIQVQYFTPQGQIGILNGPSARLFGLDLDFQIVPTRAVQIFGGISLIDHQFGQYRNAPFQLPVPTGGTFLTTGDATHNDLPFTSNFSGNIGFMVTQPLPGGNVTVDTNVYYNSGFYSEADNLRKQPAYEAVSAGIAWSSKDDLLNVRIWGKNLTNSATATQFSAGPAGVGVSYQPPRTYGVSLRVRF